MHFLPEVTGGHETRAYIISYHIILTTVFKLFLKDFNNVIKIHQGHSYCIDIVWTHIKSEIIHIYIYIFNASSMVIIQGNYMLNKLHLPWERWQRRWWRRGVILRTVYDVSQRQTQVTTFTERFQHFSWANFHQVTPLS